MKNRHRVVLDTVSLNHLLRRPKKTKGARFETALDSHLEKGAVVLALDASRGLLSEWENTCGAEAVRVVVTRWESLQAIATIKKVSALPGGTGKKLRQAGFLDQIDRLVLRIVEW